MEFVGRTVTKEFKGFGVFSGIVESYDSKDGLFKVVYEDGDSEELEFYEITSLLGAEDQSLAGELSKKPTTKVGRKQKKRRRVEIRGDSGKKSAKLVTENSSVNECGVDEHLEQSDFDHENGSSYSKIDLNSNQGLVSNGCLKSEVGFDLNCNPCIDLNLDLNGECVENKKRERCFDLNLGLDEGTRCSDVDLNGQLKEKTSVHNVEVGGVEEIPVTGGNANEGLMGTCLEDSKLNLKKGSADNVLEDSCKGSSDLHTEEGCSDAGASVNRGSRRKGGSRKKRRKDLDAENPITETVLRRSSRRITANFSAQTHASRATISPANYQPTSPPVSAVSEEKATASGCEEFEEESVLPMKLQLPPSSANLNLDDIPVHDFFSVYSCLRSFSTSLFLSPFELGDFAAALKSSAPNLLFDFVHVSLLQTLRKHLEFLSDESSQSASNCLRSLNWDLLDLITWPMFVVEYLLMDGSGQKPAFNLLGLKLVETDYYKQPASVKIEILRCLCDEVIEVEAIRSEIGRRVLALEPSADSDKNMKIESLKKRRAQIDVSGGSCLEVEEVDETADWNSDECCLCKMDGKLLCCDGCPAAYHSKCVGVSNSLLPEGDWYCPECVIDKDKPWLKLGKSLRGAEVLGSDPYGRLYYSSCGFLLVSDLGDAESPFSYYDRNDLPAVTEVLKSDVHYSAILNAIFKQWDISSNFNDAKDNVDSLNLTSYSDFQMKGHVPATPFPSLLLASSETSVRDKNTDEQKPENKSIVGQYSGNISCEVSDLVDVEPVPMNASGKMENLLTSSEGSVDISQGVTGIQNPQKNNDVSLKCSAGIFNAGKGDASHGPFQSNYANYYSFARTASSVAEELFRKPSDKIVAKLTWSVEEIISAQLKSISKNSTKILWSSIQNTGIESRREKCGWCFSCKVPDEDRECLFNIIDTCPALEGLSTELVSLHSKRDRKSHLVNVVCYILYMEERLQGLIQGPWLNADYNKRWRKSLLMASDVASVKHMFLMLESNLRHLAISQDWLKHVDSVATMGSSSHVVINSSRASSKHGIGRKRARCLDLESNTSSSAGSGLGLFWWRGGRLSRQLFNWKVLPHSMASKAARQAGCTKIPGILYPDGSEFAKRSKYVAWRAAVETSRSVEQLALQVREFDSHIRWDEIEKTNLFQMMMDKQSQKSFRLFKKAIIRRKCTEGTQAKYLLDFGKRRLIPSIVMKQGTKVEDSSSVKKKYWLEEPYVPLHLLKVFEEKRIARKSNKMVSEKSESGRTLKNPLKKRGFSYLFSKAERSENYQCGHCKKDVLIREAVCCQFCEGFYHKRHVKKSPGILTVECAYTCHKCLGGKFMKIGTKQGKSPIQKSKKVSTIGNSKKVATVGNSKKVATVGNSKKVSSSNSKKAGKNKQTAKSQKKKNSSAAVLPLRRSTRKVKCVSLQNKKAGGQKKKKQTKSKKRIIMKPMESAWQNKRTKMTCASFWLRGLQLLKKPNDERVMQFRSKKLLVSSEQFFAVDDQQPKCILCCEPEFTPKFNYIGCETCGGWFHGDAFGLNLENIGNLIGFKCYRCLKKLPPVCPHANTLSNEPTQLGTAMVNAGIAGSEELSDVLTLPNEVFVKERSQSDEESKRLFPIDESCRDEQYVEPNPNLNEKNALGSGRVEAIAAPDGTESPLFKTEENT